MYLDVRSKWVGEPDYSTHVASLVIIGPINHSSFIPCLIMLRRQFHRKHVASLGLIDPPVFAQLGICCWTWIQKSWVLPRYQDSKLWWWKETICRNFDVCFMSHTTTIDAQFKSLHCRSNLQWRVSSELLCWTRRLHGRTDHHGLSWGELPSNDGVRKSKIGSSTQLARPSWFIHRHYLEVRLNVTVLTGSPRQSLFFFAIAITMHCNRSIEMFFLS